MVGERLVLGDRKALLADFVSVGDGAALGRPTCLAVPLPLLVTEQHADGQAFELLFIPVKMIIAVAVLKRIYQVVEAALLTAEILGLFVGNGDPLCTLPLFVVVGIVVKLLLEKAGVLTLANVKRNNKDAAP